MRFIDHCRIKVVAGDGGNGVVAFRREKFIPFGGPSGGDGGRGGNVTLVADEGLSTLQDVTYQKTIVADRGGHGQGSDKYGRGGVDRLEKVPIGTQVFDEETGDLVGDLTEPGQQLLVARGGQGGRGNIHFASSFDRAPRRAEKGERGETRTLRLELKVLADVGLLGFPNVGKSTFVASVSSAKPKVADYPFTTMVPTLGVVEMHGGPRLGGSSFVVADIPGLIPGASEGTGLGIQFLKHVERTRALLHLITLDYAEDRDPVDDYEALRAELTKFSPELAERPEVVALSKIDIPEVREAFPALRDAFAKKGVRLRAVSAATREGLDELLLVLERVVRGTSREDDLTVARPKTAAIARKPPTPSAPRPKATAKTAKPKPAQVASKKAKRVGPAPAKGKAKATKAKVATPKGTKPKPTKPKATKAKVAKPKRLTTAKAAPKKPKTRVAPAKKKSTSKSKTTSTKGPKRAGSAKRAVKATPKKSNARGKASGQRRSTPKTHARAISRGAR